MKGRMRDRLSMHIGWLEGTKAVAFVGGVVEVLGGAFRNRKVLLFAWGIGATTLFGEIFRRYTN
jgi:hypothetical protein